MERALELMDVAGSVHVSGKEGPNVFEQIVGADGEYADISGGLYVYDGHRGSVVQLAAFALAVEAGRVEEAPEYDYKIKRQVTHPVV